MRVGILTWFFAGNYGAKAHSFALQQYIKSLGHECEFVQYYPSNAKVLNLKMNIGRQHTKGKLIPIMKGMVRCYRFNSWNKNYSKSHLVKNAHEIDDLGLDLIILGSDEVFNTIHPLFDSTYYGVGILKTPCITYAPSAGQDDCTKKLPIELTQSLNKMKYVSARDTNTKKLLENNCNKQVAEVVDPTMLYNFSDITSDFPESNYILIYSFNSWDEYAEQIKQYGREKNLKIISIGKTRTWADKSYDAISFTNWLGAFQKADVVVTDSFHGLVFAIKNKKQFVTLSRHDKINKINNLLQSFNIEREFYNGKRDLASYLDDFIQYDVVYKDIEERVVFSKNYIMKAIDEL